MSPGDIYALLLLGPIGHTLAVIAAMTASGITPLQALALLIGLAVLGVTAPEDTDEDPL